MGQNAQKIALATCMISVGLLVLVGACGSIVGRRSSAMVREPARIVPQTDVAVPTQPVLAEQAPLTSFVVAAGPQMIPTAAMSTHGQEIAMTEIYVTADWYRARPEPERVWHGRLQERPAVIGPTGRTTLTYTLVTADDHFPVYAPGGGHRLGPFVGHRVMVQGKLVDLRAEGLGQELWIGAIQTVD